MKLIRKVADKMKSLRIRTERGDLIKSTKNNSRPVAWSRAFPPSRYHTAKWLKSKPEEDLTLVGHPIILKETPESPEVTQRKALPDTTPDSDMILTAEAPSNFIGNAAPILHCNSLLAPVLFNEPVAE